MQTRSNFLSLLYVFRNFLADSASTKHDTKEINVLKQIFIASITLQGQNMFVYL